MKNHSLLAIIMSAGLVACGGGSGGSSNTQAPISNSSQSSSVAATSTNVAQGTVTGFGSVIVNGVHFDVKGASIEIDGESKVESDLAVGQAVSVVGTVNDDGVHGKASKLSAETRLRGPIESIDLTKGIVVVLGQTVLINGDTFYEDGVTAASLKVGDVIKVSTQINADSLLVATRIEIKTGDEAKDLLLAGEVSNLDTTAMTFTLNGTKVDYSKATIADLPNKVLKDGMLVRVHGTVVNGVFVVNGSVHSSALDLKHDGELDTKAKVELGGIVSKLNIPAAEMLLGPTFVLGNTTVFFTKGVKIEGGTLSDLANGVRVRVKGKFDADKNVIAEKIILILKARVDDEGLVQATDLTKNTLTVNGVTFEVTADTSFNDRSKADVRLFSLKDIATGDFVDVRGYKIPASDTSPERMVATRVERKNSSEKAKDGFKTEISGKVELVGSDSIKVSGHTIKITNTTTIFGFNSIQLFLANALGMSVEVEGVVENDVFIARVIKIEKDESESEHSSSSNSSSSSVKSSSSSSSSVLSSSSSVSSASSTSSAASSSASQI
ncbi:DUF5666 domain-containing protein [Cellvibrio sp.]|uniref:DUF5666 domain-containing protein n=1 Tax=Cellvibrio sp. TaxID=1965322 RepID=UPI00396487A1